MGELPELPVFIPADENLVNKAKDILHKMNIHENEMCIRDRGKQNQN